MYTHIQRRLPAKLVIILLENGSINKEMNLITAQLFLNTVIFSTTPPLNFLF